MKPGFLLKLRQWTNQLFVYLYSIIFVLIGARIVTIVQQAHGLFWPCNYVEAWWQTQGSTPTIMACSESGHELTIVIGTAIAFGIVLALVRNLEWRLRLVACVAGIYFLFRLGYIINALGREQALELLGNALYSNRLEFAGLALFALLVWLFQSAPRWRLIIVISIAVLLLSALAYELLYPSGGSFASLWKAIGLTVLASLVSTLLGYLPAKTSHLLGVDSTD